MTETRASVLFKKLYESGNNNALIRLVLIAYPEKDAWYVFYGDIVLSNAKLRDSPRIIYDKKNIRVLEIPTKKDRAYEFIKELVENSFTLTPNISVELHGRPTEQVLRICGIPKTFENSFMEVYSQHAKMRGLSFPCYAYSINLEPIAFNESNLAYYQTMSELVADTLGVTIDGSQIRYRFFAYFEIGRGKIDNFRYDGSSVKFDVIKAGDDSKYAAVIMLYKKDGSSERIPITDVEEHIEKYFDNDVESVRIKLVYDDELADEFYTYKIRPKDDNNENPYIDEIYTFKEKVRDVKKDILIPKGLEFCTSVEGRLEEAENKIEQDPKDVLQALQEAMEYLCRDFFKVFQQKPDSIGLGLHMKVIGEWMKKTSKKWKDIEYQTGVRHIIRIGASKEHNEYKPYKEEIEYLLLLAWRGYWEILKMIKEIQEVEKVFTERV